MLLAELYQEHRGSSFTHDGQKYDLNKVLNAVDDTPVDMFKVADLRWILKHTDVDEDRVKKADKSKPVLVTKWRNKLVVVDGAHRLTKAVQSGDTEMRGKIVTSDVLKAAKK